MKYCHKKKNAEKAKTLSVVSMRVCVLFCSDLLRVVLKIFNIKEAKHGWYETFILMLTLNTHFYSACLFLWTYLLYDYSKTINLFFYQKKLAFNPLPSPPKKKALLHFYPKMQKFLNKVLGKFYFNIKKKNGKKNF